MTTGRDRLVQGERLEAALAGWSAALDEVAKLLEEREEVDAGTNAVQVDSRIQVLRVLLAKPAGAVGPNSPWPGLLNDLVEQRRRMFGNKARYDGVEVARLDRLIEEVRGIVRRGT